MSMLHYGDDSSGKVMPGSVGVLVSPARTQPGSPTRSGMVHFEGRDRGVNVKFSQIHPIGLPPALPGGFVIGDLVIAMLSRKDDDGYGTVRGGDQGRVVGPDTRGSDSSISVKFKHRTRGLNCRLCQIHAAGRPPALARGLEIGDAVGAMFVHGDHHGTVGAGDRGEVNGM